jgi:inhibitor of cysteine peptidase
MTTRTFIVPLILLVSLACAMQKKPIIVGKSGVDTILVALGQPFTVTLQGNPSTGFSWNIIAIDSAKVKPAGEPRFDPRNNMPGSGGTYFFDFTAVVKGVSKIGFAYFRTWEKEIAPADSFTITVDCK